MVNGGFGTRLLWYDRGCECYREHPQELQCRLPRELQFHAFSAIVAVDMMHQRRIHKKSSFINFINVYCTAHLTGQTYPMLPTERLERELREGIRDPKSQSRRYKRSERVFSKPQQLDGFFSTTTAPRCSCVIERRPFSHTRPLAIVTLTSQACDD